MVDTHTLTRSGNGRARRAPQRPAPAMSPKQLQAYFLARATLRRLNPAWASGVPPGTQQPAAGT